MVDRIIAAVLAGVFMAIMIALILITNRLLRQGRNLPHGDQQFCGIEDWSQRRLGKWWYAEAGVMGLIYVGALANPGPDFGPLIYSMLLPIMQQGQRLYATYAYYNGLPWPGRDRQQKAAADRRKLNSQREYKALKTRNAWIEEYAGGCMIAMPATLWIILAAHGFNVDTDPVGLWLIGLAVGLAFVSPFLVVSALTWPRGGGRFADFRAYYALKNRDPGCKKVAAMLAVFGLLTIASIAGITYNLAAHAPYAIATAG